MNAMLPGALWHCKMRPNPQLGSVQMRLGQLTPRPAAVQQYIYFIREYALDVEDPNQSFQLTGREDVPSPRPRLPADPATWLQVCSRAMLAATLLLLCSTF